MTALHQAVICEKVEIFEALLRAGADPNIIDQDGNSAMSESESDDRFKAAIQKHFS